MRFIFLILSTLLITIASIAQTTQEEYIEQYSGVAISEMKRSGVPASITLAQGILESASGNSHLAKEGNNHFGIKCGKNWKGKTILWDDDAKQECFRKYNSDEESFVDHSDFLLNSPRYAFLFELDITDYESWCYGLRKAGYATSHTYAEKLISLIEKHKLYEFDKINNNVIIADAHKKQETDEKPQKIQTNNSENTVSVQSNINFNNIHINNNTPYIVVESDTDVKSLAKEIDLMPWQISRYNNLDKKSEISKGEIIYTKSKRNKAEKQYSTHTVGTNETMRDISQRYAIKLKKLYKKNDMEFGTELVPGTKLNLIKSKTPLLKRYNFQAIFAKSSTIK
jgi:LysM repeat protein